MQQRSLLVPKNCLACSGQTYSAQSFGVEGSVWFGMRGSALSFPGGVYKTNNKWTIQKIINISKAVSIKVVIVKNNKLYLTLKNVILGLFFSIKKWCNVMSTVNHWSLFWWRTTIEITRCKIIFWDNSKLNVFENCSSMEVTVTESYHKRTLTCHWQVQTDVLHLSRFCLCLFWIYPRGTPVVSDLF